MPVDAVAATPFAVRSTTFTSHWRTSCLHTFWRSLVTCLNAANGAVLTTISRHPRISLNSSSACALWKEMDIPLRLWRLAHADICTHGHFQDRSSRAGTHQDSVFSCVQRQTFQGPCRVDQLLHQFHVPVQLFKEVIMKTDSISRTIPRAVKPVPRVRSPESSSAIPFRSTARCLARASGQFLTWLRASPARFLTGRRRHDAGADELEQRMFELEVQKLSTLHLGGFLR